MTDIKQDIKEYFERLNDILNSLDKEDIAKFIESLLETNKKRGTVFIFGNGGSAANATHIAGDMVKGASYGSETKFKFICLNDNQPAMMAIANDISYDDIFVEQLKNFIGENDMAIGLSGSGNSINVVKAIEYAKNVGAKTVAICGYSGGRIKELSDISMHAEIDDMEISEDVQLIIAHCVKQIVMKKMGLGITMGEKYDKRITGNSNQDVKKRRKVI